VATTNLKTYASRRMAPRGHPRDTPERRTLRRLQREERRRKLRQTAQRLREQAALKAEDGLRRSLRLENQELNKGHTCPVRRPCFTFILFGEEGWEADDDYGYQIVVNW
jgi:hypothetical protein